MVGAPAPRSPASHRPAPATAPPAHDGPGVPCVRNQVEADVQADGRATRDGPREPSRYPLCTCGMMTNVPTNVVHVFVKRGQLRSHAFRIRGSRTANEIFVEQESLGQGLHISLHASGQWSLRYRVKGQAKTTLKEWDRPSEIVAGVTPALWLLVPSALIRYPDAPPNELETNTVGVQIADDEENVAAIRLFLITRDVVSETLASVPVQPLFTMPVGAADNRLAVCHVLIKNLNFPERRIATEHHAQLWARASPGGFVGMTLPGTMGDGAPSLLLGLLDMNSLPEEAAPKPSAP